MGYFLTLILRRLGSPTPPRSYLNEQSLLTPIPCRTAPQYSQHLCIISCFHMTHSLTWEDDTVLEDLLAPARSVPTAKPRFAPHSAAGNDNVALSNRKLSADGRAAASSISSLFER